MTHPIEHRARFSDAFPYVLMYHSVTAYDDDPYLVTVSPERFARQLEWLRQRGLRGVSMRELLAERRRGRGRDLVGLTFDDGYTDFLDNVLPLLHRHGFTATVFVIAGRLGGQNCWDSAGPRKNLMTASQVRQIAESGMEVGSHGVLHRSFPRLSTMDLRGELVHSKDVLTELAGRPVQGICYPYGDIDPRVVDAAREAGYGYGTAIWRSALSGRLALPRTYIGDRDHSWRLHAKRWRHFADGVRQRRRHVTSEPVSTG